MFDFKKFTYLHYLTDRHTHKFGLYMQVKISQLDSSLLFFSIIKYCTMVWCYFYPLQTCSPNQLWVDYKENQPMNWQTLSQSPTPSGWLRFLSNRFFQPASKPPKPASPPPPPGKFQRSKLEQYIQNMSRGSETHF